MGEVFGPGAIKFRVGPGRIELPFAGNAFSFFHQALSLVPLPSRSDTPLNGYRTGVTRRCPGAATQPHPDGSNPWVPPEASCRPEDTLR